jgi:hypothetical protein
VFCDLRGFTGFAERAEPEEVMALLRVPRRDGADRRAIRCGDLTDGRHRLRLDSFASAEAGLAERELARLALVAVTRNPIDLYKRPSGTGRSAQRPPGGDLRLLRDRKIATRLRRDGAESLGFCRIARDAAKATRSLGKVSAAQMPYERAAELSMPTAVVVVRGVMMTGSRRT